MVTDSLDVNQLNLKKSDLTEIIKLVRWVFIISLVLDLILHAYFSIIVVAISLLIAEPLTHWLIAKSRYSLAVMLLMTYCNLSLYGASVGVGHQGGFEYLCLVAAMMPFILFDLVDKGRLIFSLFWSVSFALLIMAKIGPELPGYWYPSPWNPLFMQVKNFLGAILGVGVFARVYFLRLIQARDNVVSQIGSSKQQLEEIYGVVRESERQMEEAQRIAKVGNWSYDLKSGKISWSKQLFEFYNLDTSLGEPTYEEQVKLVYPADREIFTSAVERGLRGESYHMRFRTQQGQELRWLEGIGHPEKDQSGRVVGLFGTCQDITERIMREEESRLVIESLKIGIWKFRPSDGNLHWDQSMYKLFGIDPKDFSGHYQAWESTLTPRSKEVAVQELGAALRGEKEFNTTFEIKTPAGQILHIGGRGKVFRDENGSPSLMYGINWDRTHEVELEQKFELERQKSAQSAKLASLGEMSAGVAHEINNPLAVVSGNVDLLERYLTQPEKFKAKIEVIRKSIQRISRIVMGLQKFSRTSGSSVMVPLPLTQIIQEAFGFAELKCEKLGIKLEMLPTESSIKVLCDDLELSQVFVNLVNNSADAIKDLDERWIRVAYSEVGEQVKIHVTDSGPGIAPEIHEKLFQPFFTTKAVGQGTGLGLSIVKGIVETHHGKIGLCPEHTHTCFELILPIMKS